LAMFGRDCGVARKAACSRRKFVDKSDDFWETPS
jgi:hypothetical protein